jgi:hypothetical protein
VQRHIRKLVSDGHLVMVRDSKGGRLQHEFEVACCRLSVSELEFMTGVRLRSIQLEIGASREGCDAPEKQGAIAGGISGGSPSNLSPEGSQTVTPAVTVCHPNNQVSTKEHELGLILKKKGSNSQTVARRFVSATDDPPPAPVTDFQRALIAEMLAKLKPDLPDDAVDDGCAVTTRKSRVEYDSEYEVPRVGASLSTVLSQLRGGVV